MGQTESRDSNVINISPYRENREHYIQIKDNLIKEWQNEEYPVWILIFNPEREPRIYFSEEDLTESIYFNENSYIVKIPPKAKPAQVHTNLIDKFRSVIKEFANDLDTFIRPNSPPIKMTDKLEDLGKRDMLIPATKKPTPTRKLNYEFIYDQDFRGVPISLAIVLDGRLIGVQHGKTKQFQWFIENPNHNEIRYNLLMS